MLYYISIWTGLTFVCLIVGFALLNTTRADFISRSGDRLIAATWSGLVVLSLSLLMTAVALPLRFITGISVSIVLVTISLSSSRVRTELLNLLKSQNFLLMFGALLCLEVVVVSLFNRPISWFDTGLYHIGAIRWLSRYGAVPGLALIADGFGFTSAWFALSAALIPEIIGSRMGAVTNGFILITAIAQIFILITHITNRQTRLSDWFLLISLLILILAYLSTVFTGSPILISFSPDVSVAFLINILAWLLLVDLGRLSKDCINSQHERSHYSRFVLIVIAVGAVSNKLSALPLLPFTFIYYILRESFSLKRALFASALMLMLLIPMASNSVITSGCPIFPSTTICFDLPWKVSQEKTDEHIKRISVNNDAEPQSSQEKSSIFPLVRNRMEWFKTQKKMQLMTLCFLIGFGTLLTRTINRFWGDGRKFNGVDWVIVLGFTGMTFILIVSPLIRFGLGYCVVISALLIALLVSKVSQRSDKFLRAITPFLRKILLLEKIVRSPVLKSALILLVTFSMASVLGRFQSSWILPPSLPDVPSLTEVYINDVRYTYPSDWSVRCWDANLPCAPTPISYDIRLRDPAAGIAAGFIHSGIIE